ncbi:sensor histidine kinase [Blautia schinkii]|nr:sensor histidine kinase [Blautia schinkii]
MKLRTKLLIIFSLALVIQGIVIGYQFNERAVSTVYQNKEKDVSAIVNLIDANVNTKVMNIEQILHNTTDSGIVQEIFYSGNQQMPSEFTETIKYMENIDGALGGGNCLFLVKDGRVRLQVSGDESSVENISLPINWKELCKEAAERPDRVIWGNTTSSVIKEENTVIPAATAVLDSQGKNLGFLFAELNPDIFSSLLVYNKNDFENQYTFIMDKKGKVLCSNKGMDEEWAGRMMSIFGEGKRRFQMVRENQKYYVCGQYNGLTGWTVFYTLANRYIFPGAKDMQEFLYMIVVLCTACAALLVFLMSYTITRPINRLSAAMKKVQDGDFSVRLPNKNHRDEIGKLTDSFNFMTDKIQVLIREVYQEKIAQKNAEMEALQAQINPHFLYNTLDSVNWMLIDKGDFETSEVIVSLGNLMKYCLDKHNSMVPLSREIDYVLSYLLIQKNRLEARLEYELQVDEAVKAWPVPKLIVQPLVENAIIHGSERTKNPVKVTISAREYQGVLSIEVQDDGIGMQPEELQRLKQSLEDGDSTGSSIGLRNVERRIRLHYGEEYRLFIDSTPGYGTRVVMCIPPEQDEGREENK